MEKTKVTIELPEWMVERVLHPKNEEATKMAAAWLLGAVLVQLDPLDTVV